MIQGDAGTLVRNSFSKLDMLSNCQINNIHTVYIDSTSCKEGGSSELQKVDHFPILFQIILSFEFSHLFILDQINYRRGDYLNKL